MANEKETELDKARGQTESQKKIREYNAGKFQTHDPVTGEKRGELALHARPEFQGGAIGEEQTESAESVRARKSAVKAAKKSTAVAPMSTADAPKAKRSRKK